MPYELSKFQLPSGALCGRVTWTGVTTAGEATAVRRELSPGGQLQGLSLLVLTQKMETMTPEARRVFSGGAEQGWIAIVVSSPVIRVATNFILRMANAPKRRMFTSESEAIQWLDERVREPSSNNP
jgi:hypothetical protein